MDHDAVTHVGDDQDALVVGRSLEADDVGVRVEQLERAARERRAGPAQGEQLAVPVQERVGVGVLGLDVDSVVVVVERQPRGDTGFGEAGAWLARPRHRARAPRRG